VAFFRPFAVAAFFALLARGEDPVAALAHRIDQGSANLPFDAAYGFLPGVLEALHVPVESQIAVFSKTSIQGMIIQPSNPRVLYFNDSVSVGWVHGGFIEFAAQDAAGEITYYVLMQRPDAQITRRQDCAKCHKNSALMVRSVHPSPVGLLSEETDVDGRTPFSKLWGGWFVTGDAVPPGHAGNAVYESSKRLDMAPVFDAKFSLTPSSDVVALMVFAHQMRVMNLLAHADLAHPDNVNELADALLFADDRPLPGKIRGNSGFAEKFSAQGPRDSKGRSLREFDLQTRLMRYPCSYMVYSDAFDGLAAPIRQAVYRRMWGILSGEITGPAYSALSRENRMAVIEILRETKPDLPEYFRTSQALR
jgi:hypothetical protein